MADEEQDPTAAAESPVEDSPKKRRVYHSLAAKVDMCIECEKVVRAEKKMSMKAFCREKEVDPSQLRRWTKRLVHMKQAMDNTSKKKSKLVCGTGRRSRLWPIKDRLLQFAESKQALGQNVSIRRMAIQARRHDRSLRRMKRYSLFAMVRRFCRSHGVVMRAHTHRSQEDPHEKMEVATAFLKTTIPRIHQTNRHPAYIINMDQTPYNPKDTEKRTLAKRGAKTVNSKQIKTSVGRITGCLTVCADGTKLKPLLVYKGKPSGTVIQEVRKYNGDIVCTVQENAWCDERVMLIWVDEVLKPYVSTAPPGVVPYLLLDKYTCHYQGTVARAIEDLGVEWDILPGGCTGLIQPIDVGINRPWKNRLRYRVEDFIMENESYDRLAPSRIRPLMAKWALDSWAQVQTATVFNSWRHKPFSYFPEERTLNVAFQDDDFDYSDDEDDEEYERQQESAETSVSV